MDSSLVWRGGWVTEVIGAAATRTPIEASSLCREVRGPSTTFGWSPHFAQDVSTWVDEKVSGLGYQVGCPRVSFCTGSLGFVLAQISVQRADANLGYHVAPPLIRTQNAIELIG